MNTIRRERKNRKWKALLIFLAASSLLWAGSGIQASARQATVHEQVPGEKSVQTQIDTLELPTNQIILKYTANSPAFLAPAQAGQMNRLNTAAGITMQFLRKMRQGATVLRLPQSLPVAQVQAIADHLKKLPEVEYAEPDLIMQPALIPNDPQLANQWQYFTPSDGNYGINAPAAWDITTGAPGIVVAVLDTGITNHSELNARTVPGYDFITNVQVANDGDGRDADPSDPGDWITAAEHNSGIFAGCPITNSTWHGTHTAGSIGAASNNGVGVSGINWNSKILPVRVLGKCLGFTSDIIDGMSWAAGLSVTGVPDNPNPAKVENLSLAGKGACGTTLQAAINAITATGTTIVVSAGNAGADASGYNPANCSEVIAVAATNRSGSRAWYSNYGANIGISAPGGDTSVSTTDGILSTFNTGLQGPVAETYAYDQGTSMAAAQVSGVVSLLYSLNPLLTPSQALQIIQTTATNFPAGSSCDTSTCGSGIVNAGAAAASMVNTLTVTKSGTGSGTVNSLPAGIDCGTTCTAFFTNTSSVTLTAINDSGSTFSGWNGSGCSGTGTCLLSMDSAKTVDAEFSLNGVVISGNAGVDGATLSYNDGSDKTVNSNTDGSYSIPVPDNWSGTVTPSKTGYTFLPDKTTYSNVTSDQLNQNYAATLNTYTLSISKSGTGSGTISSTPTGINCGATCSALFNYNTSVTLNASATSGSGFTGWSGSGCSGTSSCVLSIDSAKNVSANFDVLPGSFGKYYPANGATGRPAALTISWLTSTRATSYDYCIDTSDNGTCDTNWINTGTTRSAVISGLMGNTTYYWQVRGWNGQAATTADGGAWWHFTTSPCYTITVGVNPGAGGSVGIDLAPNCAGGKYASATVLHLTATGNGGYSFTNWSGNASGSTNPLVVTVSMNKSITANFAIQCFTLTADGANGTVNASPSPNCAGGKYNYGTMVQLTAVPNTGYGFTSWGGDASGTANPVSVTMNGDMSVTASFAVPCYTLSASGANGTFQANPAANCAGGKYSLGSVVQLTAVPNTGYSFTTWSGDASGTANPASVTMDADKTVNANFTALCYTLTTAVSPAGLGSVGASPTPNCSGGKYSYGTTIQLTAYPIASYGVQAWSGDMSGSANPGPLFIDGNKSVTANFVALPAAFSKYYPTSGATGRSTVITLSWLTSTRATSYEYCLTTLNTGVCDTGWVSTGSNRTAALTGLAGNTIYYWQVRSAIGGAKTAADGGSWWSFTTGNCYTMTTGTVPTGSGSVGIDLAPNCAGGKYGTGSILHLTATANGSYTFSNWSGNANGSLNPLTVTMSQNKTITANFH